MSARKTLALLVAGLGLSAEAAQPLSLLVRDLRTVKDGRCVVFNIGTAAHAPSSVAQVLKAWPDADVTLWADAPLEDGYAAMIRRRFPNVGIEMHSQVMALGNGVPAVLFHHPGFGTKADMWRTIGCGDWRVDLTAEGATKKAVDVVGGILADPAAAARCRAARAFLDRSAREMFRRMGVNAGLISSREIVL